ncbi:spore germination protein [Neobacillus sp. WH10]|uniref:spore germination protein n=1 Tax=Neobacillus sp. WH10 TaxID=3047873 RepID=UPI0024C1BF95|nr:spore germination protein [Neobacillus sp. WH10]WHY75155.1 spore germination protein [Neobacillus sp. WH10]
MPANIFGPIQITTISANGVVEFGDSLVVSPKVASKTPSGAGSFNTAIWVMTSTAANNTIFINSSVTDQPISGTL